MTKIKGLAGYPWPAPWAYEFQCIVIRKYFSGGSGSQTQYLRGYEPRMVISFHSPAVNGSGRRRSCTSTVFRHAWHPWELIPTLSNAPPRSFHPSIQESTFGIHHSYSGLSAILNFSRVGENVRSELIANQLITDFLAVTLYGTFVRLPQAYSSEEQPSYSSASSDSFILLVNGGERPY